MSELREQEDDSEGQKTIIRQPSKGLGVNGKACLFSAWEEPWFHKVGDSRNLRCFGGHRQDPWIIGLALLHFIAVCHRGSSFPNFGPIPLSKKGFYD